MSYSQKLASGQMGPPQLPLLPKGMIETKPSEVKNAEKIERERL
mgnify:CR=1 FL=1